jgi:general secretion pathway protein H
MTHRHPDGFTLIELIVVMSLISIFLFFSLPRVRGIFTANHINEVARHIILRLGALKDEAVFDQSDYDLRVDIDQNTLLIMDKTAGSKDSQEVKENYKLPETVRIMDVAYPQKNTVTSGQAVIHFSRNGFAQPALIHIENSKNEKMTFYIEPFLPKIAAFPSYVDFEEITH